MTDLIFLDTETTGLDPELHEIWEIAYAINDGPIFDLVLPHSVQTADLKALEMNGYYERSSQMIHPNTMNGSNDLAIRKILTDNTIVGANPAFDAAFLRKRWGVAPWHYRLIDIESMAIGVLGYARPKGLAGIASDLRSWGYDIPVPNHSAAKDVEVVRAAYKTLRHIIKGVNKGTNHL